MAADGKDIIRKKEEILATSSALSTTSMAHKHISNAHAQSSLGHTYLNGPFPQALSSNSSKKENEEFLAFVEEFQKKATTKDIESYSSNTIKGQTSHSFGNLNVPESSMTASAPLSETESEVEEEKFIFSHIDDSSDEENIKTRKRDIHTFQFSRLQTPNRDNAYSESLTKLAVSYGVQLLYCRKVEALYQLKKKTLDEDYGKDKNFDKLTLINEIKSFLSKDIKTLFDLSPSIETILLDSDISLQDNIPYIMKYYLENFILQQIAYAKNINELVVFMRSKPAERFLEWVEQNKNTERISRILLPHQGMTDYFLCLKIFDSMLRRCKIENSTQAERCSGLRKKFYDSYNEKVDIHYVLRYILDEVLTKLIRRIRTIQYDKPYLPENYYFESKEPAEHLANLRLSVRFIRRYGKHAIFNDSSRLIVKTFTVRHEFKHLCISHGVALSQGLVVTEQQKLDLTRSVRNDLSKKEKELKLPDRDDLLEVLRQLI